jgi:protein-tyrosine phosphatase
LEENFFKANPSLGEAHMKQIFGDLTSPAVLPRSYVEEQAKTLDTWQIDHLPTYIPSLNKMLKTKGPQGVPTVIYFHCECGCDRTGEIAGSYAMKYLNMTYVQAYAWDDEVAGRWILPNHNWALEWYCEYLNYVEGMKVQPCTA